METTTSNVLVQGHYVLDKLRSRIAPKTPTPHTLSPPYHQEKPELEDVVRDIADKAVRDTAEGTIENTLQSTVEKVFENTSEGLVGNIFKNHS